MASCTEFEASSAKPVLRAAITSLWSPKIDSACVATVRAETWNTRRGQLAGDLEHVGDHQQQALRRREGGGQRAGLQARRAAAPAAPPSLCISTTVGTVPQMFGFPFADHSSAHSPMFEEGVIG